MKNKRIKVCMCIAAVLIGAITALNCGVSAIRTQSEASDMVLLIDPGHGGIDGGAVSSDGTPEKDINLEISFKLKEAAEANGWQVVMTRDTDVSLGAKVKGSIRSQKTEDLRVRCEMLKKYEPTAAVSIHLNSFKSDPSVNGAQVFYPDHWEDKDLQQQCKDFAGNVQQELSKAIKAEKDRVPLVREGVFLFREEVCPIVIVECGFVSNNREARLLKNDEYQQMIADGILSGITEFTGFEGKDKVMVIDSFEEKNK